MTHLGTKSSSIFDCSNIFIPISFLQDTSMEQLMDDHPFKTECNLNHKLYQRGEVIYHEDTPSFGFYYVSKGTVKVFTTDKNGREVILRLARTGDIIGHEYLLGERHHTDSSKALEETICQFLDGNEFMNLMINNPSMSFMIMKKMKEEKDLIKNRCIDLIRKNVRERLASFFHYMSEYHAEQDEKGLKIRIQLSREEIASLIGTANETAIRFIGEFKELGLIQEEDRVFYILDKKKLGEIAKM